MKEIEREGWKERARKEGEMRMRVEEEVKRLRRENEEMARRIETMGGGGVPHNSGSGGEISINDETIDVDQINY